MVTPKTAGFRSPESSNGHFTVLRKPHPSPVSSTTKHFLSSSISSSSSDPTLDYSPQSHPVLDYNDN